MATSAPGGIPFEAYGREEFEDRPFGAVIVSFIAGLFILIDGAIVWSVGGAVASVSPVGGELVAGLGAVGFFLGFLILLLAITAHRRPEHHTALGVLIVVFSFVSLISGGGFILGLVLGFVGGIWLILFVPDDEADLPTFSGGARTCRNCGRTTTTRDPFCASCGSPLPA